MMPFSARLVALTIALRFLSDHLAGNKYFKIDRANHNLDRARLVRDGALHGSTATEMAAASRRGPASFRARSAER